MRTELNYYYYPPRLLNNSLKSKKDPRKETISKMPFSSHLFSSSRQNTAAGNNCVFKGICFLQIM